MHLGEIVFKYRKEHNITMDEFAKSSGLSKGYISMLEKNINPNSNKAIVPSISTIKRIAQATSIDINEIINMLDSEQKISVLDQPNIKETMLILLAKNSTFSDTLRNLRLERGLTQTELADKIGLSKSAISMYENGNREPDFDSLLHIADLFNVNLSYLIGEKQEDGPIGIGESKLLDQYRKLNDIGKKEAINRVEELTHIPRYQLTPVFEIRAAHNEAELTDEELEKMRKDLDDL